MSLQHMVSSIDDLISYTDGKGKIYTLDFRIKFLWFTLTILSAIICLDLIFTMYLFLCTLILQFFGRSPVFQKIRRNKALITFVFALIIISFIMGFVNRALVKGTITAESLFFFFARAVAIGFVAVTIGTLFMTMIQTTRTIEMTAGRGPTLSILTFLTFRSIPLVSYHLNNVIDAQRARGLELEKLGPKTVIRGITAVFIPLLVLLTGSIDRTSKVLEARGINPRVRNKTSYVKTKFRFFELFITVYIFFQFIFSIWLALTFSPNYETTTLTYHLFSQWGLL